MKIAGVVVVLAAGTAHADRGTFAVRAGVHHMHVKGGEGEPDGNGPIAEGSWDWHVNDYIDVGPVAGLGSMRDTFASLVPSYVTVHYRWIDLIARVSAHGHGVFGGVGVGVGETYNGERWQRWTLAEAHLGYTFPRIERAHIAPQLMVVTALGDLEHSLTLTRQSLMLGVAF